MAIVPVYHKAERLACKASVAIEGLPGQGKSGLALAMAYVLAGESWDGVCALDTENKSLNLYVDTPLHIGVTLHKNELNLGQLTAKDGFKPSHYDAWRQAAIDMGAKAWVSDSFSHLWQYKGGILDMVNQEQMTNRSVNKYTVWGVPYIAEEKLAIMDLVRCPELHTILTIRVKEKMEMEKNDEGKTIMRSIGEQQIMMPDFKFEPDLVLQMVKSGYEDQAPVAKVIKTRYRILKLNEEYAFDKNLLIQLRMYLEEGTNPEELLEMQRKDYVEAVKQYLKDNNNLKPVWDALKENIGYKETKLNDLPLKILKQLFGQLVSGQ